MDFKLESLGWRSFQDLAAAVCQEQFGCAVELYSAGPDFGRDAGALLLVKSKERPQLGRVVVQCKHSADRGRLSRNAIDAELPKIKKLVTDKLCDTYIFFTSQSVPGGVAGEIVKKVMSAGVPSAIVLGRESINNALSMSPRLRGSVPRVYGLGDLSEILDERLIQQTQQMLDLDDLARFVPTEAYNRTIKVLDSHSFVLLLGEPACGKSSIMRAAAVFAADKWALESRWLGSTYELKDHWNPNRNDQLFLVDDAFGSTQFDSESADLWNKTIPVMKASLRAGNRIILTSRNYVFAAAMPHMKRTELPVSMHGEVVIEVDDMSRDDRRKIVYNHLRLGTQSTDFKRQIKPHLMQVTSSRRFLPETARRLGDTHFTAGLDPSDFASVQRFVEEPKDYLKTVIRSLRSAQRHSLFLVVSRGGALGCSLQFGELDHDLMTRCSLTLEVVATSLAELEGSMVRRLSGEDGDYWQVRHPTITDAMCEVVLEQDFLLDVYLRSAPGFALVRQVALGGQVAGAIQVPPELWPLALSRVMESDFPADAALRFLYFRCSRRCIERPEVASFAVESALRRGFRAPLDGDPALRLLLRLWSMDLLGEDAVARAADLVREVAVSEFDPYALRNPAVAEMVLSLPDGADRWWDLVAAHAESLRGGLKQLVSDRIREDRGEIDRFDVFAGVVDLIQAVQSEAPGNLPARSVSAPLRRIRQWAGEPAVAVRGHDTREMFLRAVFGSEIETDVFSDVDD